MIEQDRPRRVNEVESKLGRWQVAEAQRIAEAGGEWVQPLPEHLSLGSRDHRLRIKDRFDVPGVHRLLREPVADVRGEVDQAGEVEPALLSGPAP
ncbi:hypothetical protein ACWDMR_00230 [Streptomyces althioticus]|uniref:hypothetical protein n=1 Tax=Streptomyces TaxID=1883 RepID=UPI001D110CFF|nr:hypothetical protein [Streptomyces sp. CT1-17]MCC2269986.1 hypothetical protein [Streptomyces sp. CT1-17]